MVRVLRNKWFWVAAFSLLFVLSIDLWAWDWSFPTLFGLPYIVTWIAVLETALFALYLLFARYYWTGDGGEP
ncbi:MAG: hypothetical protein QG582_689 [Candidatus Thermoplasmatota archaeon]|nr:hypothetical protein [Candidatus Thermoplasmatota archaeon]